MVQKHLFNSLSKNGNPSMVRNRPTVRQNAVTNTSKKCLIVILHNTNLTGL